MKRILLIAATLLVSTPRTEACWTRLDPRAVAEGASLIVVGKVVKIEDAGFSRKHEKWDRKYDAAVVEVREVLKGRDGRRYVRLAQPAQGGLRVSTDIRYKLGQEGIWLLDRDGRFDVYWADHPDKFRELKDRDEVAQLLRERIVRVVRLVRDPVNQKCLSQEGWGDDDRPRRGPDEKDEKEKPQEKLREEADPNQR
jgi:hypothetical protein